MKLLPQTALSATAVAVAAVFSLPVHAETPSCSFQGVEECRLSEKKYTLSGRYQNGVLSGEEMARIEQDMRENSRGYSLFSINDGANVVAEPNTSITVDKSLSDYDTRCAFRGIPFSVD
mgnify:CR=1 FL=1